MATISVGGAVGEGFSLIRRHPGSVALWALLVWGLLIVRVVLTFPAYSAMFAEFTRAAGAGAKPDMAAILPQMQQAQALGLLLGFASLFLNTVVICAIYRAVLRPEQSQFGYLRVGSAELFLFVFTIGAVIAFSIAAVVVAIPLVIIGAVVGHGSLVGGVTFGVIAGIVAVIGVIYIGLRLSLIGPMMVDDGQFHLGDAWTLTRGKAGSLFLIGFVLIVLILVGEVVLASLGFAGIAAAAGGFGQWQALAQQPMVLLSRLAPALAIFGLVWLVAVACAMPILSAPWARAYRDLKQTDLAATFG